MPTLNVAYEEYPVAAKCLTELAAKLDALRESDPSLAEGIDDDKLATLVMFEKLAKLAAMTAPDYKDED